MMKQKERMKVLATLEHLYDEWEQHFDCILKQTESECIENDFFEDLYEILYEFPYNEKRLLARVWKLMDIKTAKQGNKNTENRYN